MDLKKSLNEYMAQHENEPMGKEEKKAALKKKKISKPFKGEEGKKLSKKQDNLRGMDLKKSLESYMSQPEEEVNQ